MSNSESDARRNCAPKPYVIDVHTHVQPDPHDPAQQLPDMGAVGLYGFAKMEAIPCTKEAWLLKPDGSKLRKVDETLWSVERRMRDCDERGVSAHVLSTVPILMSYHAPEDAAVTWTQFLNDHMAGAVARQPDRLVGLGTVPMQHPDLAVAELERCRALGLAGIQIGSHVNEAPLHDAKFLKIFKKAEELDMAIFVHPWDMMGSVLMKDYFLPWLVGMPAETSLAMCSFMMGGVLEQCPSLRVMFAHGGGSFPGTLARIEHGWAARPDLCQAVASISPQQHCDQRHVWVDSLVHDAHALESIVRTFGAERVALGTDYPFPLGEFRADETAKVESGDSKFKIYDAGALVFSMAATKGEGWAEGGDLRTQLLSGAALSWLGPRAAKNLQRPS